MWIEKARIGDLDAIMGIYDHARAFMALSGNPKQWGNGYPERRLLEADIAKGNCYVCVDDGGIRAVFVFIIWEDPTYSRIEDGTWKNDEPYGAIHRLAGSGEVKGVAKECFDYCKSQIANLRADTHDDNRIMQHLLEKNGFERCGIIHVEDGSPRIAYQFVRA
jgi:hypothetical protein